MTKLNQLIAVEKGVKDETNREIDGVYKTVQKTDSFAGIARRYQPFNDEAGQEEQLPEEQRRVQSKAQELLVETSKKWARLMDVVATKDFANTSAKGSIVVDGQTIIGEVPVTTLLWLEKQLNDVSTVVSKLPVLDISREWEWDDVSNAWKSMPEHTRRTKKILHNHLVAPATDKHPAQVQVFSEDEPVGTWTTTHFSGALQSAQIAELKERVSKLQKAVKFAREEANSDNVTDVKIGEKMFDYILEGLQV